MPRINPKKPILHRLEEATHLLQEKQHNSAEVQKMTRIHQAAKLQWIEKKKKNTRSVHPMQKEKQEKRRNRTAKVNVVCCKT